MKIIETDVAKLFGGVDRYEADEELQRPYVWERDSQWTPLWDDIREAADKHLSGEKPPDHFFARSFCSVPAKMLSGSTCAVSLMDNND